MHCSTFVTSNCNGTHFHNHKVAGLTYVTNKRKKSLFKTMLILEKIVTNGGSDCD